MHAAMERAATYQVTPNNGSADIADEGGVGTDGPIDMLLNRSNRPQQQLAWLGMENLALDETSNFLNGDMLVYMYLTSTILESN